MMLFIRAQLIVVLLVMVQLAALLAILPNLLDGGLGTSYSRGYTAYGGCGGGQGADDSRSVGGGFMINGSASYSYNAGTSVVTQDAVRSVRPGSISITYSDERPTALFTGGNVGIGLTNPVYNLDVLGTGRFTGTLIVGTPTNNSHATTKSYGFYYCWWSRVVSRLLVIKWNKY